jgi:CBS domain-containing protein
MTNRQMAEIVRNQVPVTLPRTATIQDACKLMHARKVGAILVTDAKGKLLGIFTGRDAVKSLSKAHDAAATQLKDVMTKKPATMPPGQTAVAALRLMRDGGFRHIPVVDDAGALHGVVSRGDFRGLEHDRLDEETGYWERIG